MKLNNRLSSVPMLWVALVLIAGIALREYCSLGVVSAIVIGVVAIVCDLLLKRPSFLLYSLIFFGGYLLGERSESDLNFDTNEIYICTVESPVRVSGKWQRFDARLLGSRDSLMRYSDFNTHILCNVDSSVSVALGDTLSLRGKLRRIKGEYGAYLMHKSVEAQLYSFDSFVIGSAEKPINNLRERAVAKIAAIDTSFSQATALMSAMTIGSKEAMSSDTVADYRHVGAAHLLAISGLHIGIVVMLLNFLFGAVKLWNRHGRLVFSIIVILALWGYAVFSGMSLSVARAAIMFTLYQLAVLLNRDGTSINILSTSAVVILLFDPMALYDVGFQLSFSAMVGISLFFRPLCSLWKPSFWLFRVLYSGFCVSVAAQITVLPLIAFHFGNIPWAGVALCLVIWLSVPLIIFSTVIYLATSIWVVGMVGVYAAEAQNRLFALLGSVDWLVVEDVEVSGLALILTYVLIGLFALFVNRWANKRSRRKVFKFKPRS